MEIFILEEALNYSDSAFKKLEVDEKAQIVKLSN